MEQFIEVSSVIVPEDRQRSNMDPGKLEELRQSIAALGLLNPITLEDDGRTLRAGERRLAAIKLLAAAGQGISFNQQVLMPGLIPFTLLGKLTPRERMLVEFDENMKRENLPWQDEARIIAQLHQVHKAENPAQTFEATGKILAASRDKPFTSAERRDVRDAIQIVDYLDDPEVAKAKNAKEARKIVQGKVEKELNEALVALVGEEGNLEEDENRIFKNLSMQDFIRSLEDESVAVIVTDPPYGIDADKFNEQATTKHEYQDSFEYFQSLMDVFAEESFRVTEPEAHLYLFCDLRNYHFLCATFARVGWQPWHRPLIWNKLGEGMLPDPDHGPRNTYECILYARKGNRAVLRVGNDVISCKPPSVKRHGAQKPVALYKDLLGRSALPGDTVADFFAGSGTIFEAAKELNLRAIGCELDTDIYNKTLLHLRGEGEQTVGQILGIE